MSTHWIKERARRRPLRLPRSSSRRIRIAKALLSLLGLVILAAPAVGQFNLRHDLSFYSCQEDSYWTRKIDNSMDNHFGRLTIESSDRAILHQEGSIPFTNDSCQAHLTMTFTDVLIQAFLLENQELFFTFEACRPDPRVASCEFDNSDLLPPLALGRHLNSVLPDLTAVLNAALAGEAAAREQADAALAETDAALAAADAALAEALESTAQGLEQELAEKVSREGDSMTGDLVMNGGKLLLSACPDGVDDVMLMATDGSYANALCASEMLTTPPGTQTLDQVISDSLRGICRTTPDGTFVQAAAFMGPVLNQILNGAIHAINDAIDDAEGDVDAVIAAIRTPVNNILGNCTGNTSSTDCTPSSLAFYLCAISPTCPYHFQIWPPTNVDVPDIPDIPVGDIADALGDWVDLWDDACNDIGTVLYPVTAFALTSVSWPIPGGGSASLPSDPLDWPNVRIPSLQAAQMRCLARGAHICTSSEVSLLAQGQNAHDALGYNGGEWLGSTSSGDPLVTYDTTGSSFLFAVPWPPVTANMEAFWEFPPGFPMGMTPPRLPEGRFRCCTSSAVVP